MKEGDKSQEDSRQTSAPTKEHKMLSTEKPRSIATPASISKREHGTRAKYVQEKCRCDACKKANRDYYHVRQARGKAAAQLIEAPLRPVEQWWTPPSGERTTRTYSRACPGLNGVPCGRHLRKDSKGGVCGVCRERLGAGLVDAEPARKHLKKLSKQGVGYKSVADAAKVSQSSLFKVMTGKRKRVRQEYMQAVLSVDKEAIADKALVSAKKTWELLDKLLEEGFSKAEIARRLGFTTPAIQIKKDFITAKTELRVQKLYNTIMAEVDEGDDICSDCGLSHEPSNRISLLRKMLPTTGRMVKRRYPCFYGYGSTKDKTSGNRMLWRDLAQARREQALEEKLEDKE